MQNVHKTKQSRNHAIVIVTILSISVFALSLPHPPYVQAKVKAPKTSMSNDSRLAIQAKTIEQRGPSGETQARLRVIPGRSLGESEFTIEQIHHRNAVDVVATGKLKAVGNKVKVIIRDAKNGVQLSMKSQADPENSGLTFNRLSFNGAVYKFAFDVERATTLAGEMRKLLADGKQAEASQLGLQLTKMLAPDQRYSDFVKQVRSSSAFDALATTASLLATATPEETSGDFTLSAITYATKLLAPSAWIAARSGRVIGGLQPQKPQIAKVGFTGSNSTFRSQPFRSRQVEFCCSACILWLAGVAGCLAMYDWCIGTSVGSGWCEFFLAGCLAGDIALAITCYEYCSEC